MKLPAWVRSPVRPRDLRGAKNVPTFTLIDGGPSISGRAAIQRAVPLGGKLGWPSRRQEGLADRGQAKQQDVLMFGDLAASDQMERNGLLANSVFHTRGLSCSTSDAGCWLTGCSTLTR